MVTSTAPVGEQPEAAQVARAAARAVAEACHGTLYDPLVGGVVYHCAECPGEREGFDLGDDWLGWRLSCADPEAACARGADLGGGTGTVPGDGASDGTCGGPGEGTGDGVCPEAGGVEEAVDTVDTLGASGCACLVAMSRGLRRFGLPEITLTGLACVHSLCAVTALRTAAEALLEGHLTWLSTSPQAPFRSIDHRLRLAGAEYAVVSAGWGEAEERPSVAGSEYAVVSAGWGKASGYVWPGPSPTPCSAGRARETFFGCGSPRRPPPVPASGPAGREARTAETAIRTTRPACWWPDPRSAPGRPGA